VRGAAAEAADLALLREYLAADRTMAPDAIRVHFLGLTEPLPLATSGHSPQGWADLTAAMIARRYATGATVEATSLVSTAGTAPVTLPASGQITVTARNAVTALAVAEQQAASGAWMTRGWALLSPNAEESGLASAVLPLTPGIAGAGRIRLTMAKGTAFPIRLSATATAAAAVPVTQALPGARYQVSGAAVTNPGAFPDNGQLTRTTTPAVGSWATGEAIGWSGEPDRAGVIADLGAQRALGSAALLVAGGGLGNVGWPRHVSMLLATCKLRTTAGAGPLPCTVTPLAVRGPTGITGSGASLTGIWTGTGPATGRYLLIRSTVSTLSMWQRLRITAPDGSAAAFSYSPLLPPSPALEQSNYPDDGLRLTDGQAAESLNRYLVTGFPAAGPGSVTLSYGTARSIGSVDIWLVSRPTWGVVIPSGLTATVNGVRYPMACLPGREEAVQCHAAVPPGLATMVTVSWPVAGAPTSWVMPSEIAAAA